MELLSGNFMVTISSDALFKFSIIILTYFDLSDPPVTTPVQQTIIGYLRFA